MRVEDIERASLLILRTINHKEVKKDQLQLGMYNTMCHNFICDVTISKLPFLIFDNKLYMFTNVSIYVGLKSEKPPQSFSTIFFQGGLTQSKHSVQLKVFSKKISSDSKLCSVGRIQSSIKDLTPQAKF